MKFMNVIKKFGSRAEMVEYRNGMLDEAETLLGEGKTEEYEAKLEDVKTFDKEYAEYTEKLANIEAMKGAVSARHVMSGAVTGIVDAAEIKKESDIAYRRAFMNFVLKGEKIPADLKNASQYTTTSDVSAVIPNTILDRIVEKMETTGTILAKVTRTFFKGGVTVPASSAKPVATWTTERGKVDTQKKSVTPITFTYHKLKCVVAVSLTVDNVTLEVFEKTIANNIAEAMIKAIETAIINGDGQNKPKGILRENPGTGRALNVAKTGKVTYKTLCDAEAAVPAAYEGAEWLMTKKTYFSEVVGMTDTNGQPIARVNVGIDGKPAYTILGRPVNFVDSEVMSDYSDTVEADTIFAAIFRFEDYMFNTNMDIAMKQYDDEDTDDKMTKAIMLADGKVVDVESLVTLTKKAS